MQWQSTIPQTREERDDEEYARLEPWHRWFAWKPVTVSTQGRCAQRVWGEWVMRCATGYGQTGNNSRHYNFIYSTCTQHALERLTQETNT